MFGTHSRIVEQVRSTLIRREGASVEVSVAIEPDAHTVTAIEKEMARELERKRSRRSHP